MYDIANVNYLIYYENRINYHLCLTIPKMWKQFLIQIQITHNTRIHKCIYIYEIYTHARRYLYLPRTDKLLFWLTRFKSVDIVLSERLGWVITIEAID
jgi:hypothetical protein